MIEKPVKAMHELLSWVEGMILSGQVAILDYRGVIAVGGADRHRFVQGLVSNDVMLAGRDRAVYTAMLTPQGKFQHDLFIVETGDALWLDCEAARVDDLLKNLKRYKLRSDVTLTDLTTDYGVAVAFGLVSGIPQRNGIPAGAGMTDGFVFFDPRLPALGQRMIGRRTQLPPVDADAARAYNHLRLTLGVPDGSRDMVPGESILLEYNLERLNGISFTKGCYIGQELTARTYYRALIKKRAFPVRITGPCPALGTVVMAGEQEVGVMRSGQEDVGLAVLKIDVVQSAAVLTCGTATLAVQPVESMPRQKS